MALFGRAQMMGGRQTTATPPHFISNVVAWYDRSQHQTNDLIGTAHVTTINMSTSTQNGLTVHSAPANARLETSSSALAGTSQPFGVTLVAKNNGNQHIYFNHGTTVRP